MLFNSLQFLFIFLPVTYWVFWKLQNKDQRYIWMALTGYIFYSFWNYKFCLLMALSTMVSYLAGLGFLKWEDEKTRKRLLVIPIAFDLLLLGVFKYANFTFSSFNVLASAAGISARAPFLDIILPVGISFYTFHTITYIVDSYRRVIVPTRNVFEFACYVSLFPQLVAGPIVRFREIENDLHNIYRHDRKESFDRGWSFFLLGLCKKVLIADTIALVINPALEIYGLLGTVGAWLCALGYSYQLYFDFSGYSDMAVGLGLMFGLRLPQNFNSPYKASSISDFWRRWHISLSSILRDYLFIPMGGSRGTEWQTCRNLMITMLLGGLWHGANWTFVIWGGYHGMLLVAQRLFGRFFEPLPAWVRHAGTFLLVVVGWVLFRSDTFAMAASLLRAMIVWTPGMLPVGWPLLALFICLAGGLAHLGPNTFELKHTWRPAVAYAFVVLLGLCLVMISGGTQSPFLYFQF